jgi:SAM-dependent methyltransferase
MNRGFSKIRFLLLTISGLMAFAVNAQSRKDPGCKILGTDLSDLSENYGQYHRCLGVKSGETVASVGAGYGRIELHVSLFVDSVQWTLQDIDTTCLSRIRLKKSIKIYERSSGRKINCSFKAVLGHIDDTNLPQKTFDRIVMVDTYHELSSREKILRSIAASLKPSGRLVIMERMGNKEGDIHGCGFPKVLESNLIPDLQNYGFEFVSKVIPNEKLDITYYTFRLN